MLVKDMNLKGMSPKFTRKRPTVRMDSRDSWKYQLENDHMSLDFSIDDSSFISTTSTSSSALPVTMRPKSRFSGRHTAPDYSQQGLRDRHGECEESTSVVDFDFPPTDQEHDDQYDTDFTNERRRSCHSSSSTISTASSYSFMKRLQTTEPESILIPPLRTSAMEKQYAVKAHLKLAADQLTESLGIHPVPLYQRPVGYLYHQDGKARRAMSPTFQHSHHSCPPLSSSSTVSCPNTPFLVSLAKTDRPPFSPLGSKTKKKLPPLSPGKLPSPNQKSMGYVSSFSQGRLRSSSIMNDSDFDDDTLSLSQHPKFLDEEDDEGGNAEDSNIFLQENALNDTFSWIKDMPRYLQDTGNVKPLTLRTMSKSCRLGNFVVDEPLDLKDFD